MPARSTPFIAPPSPFRITPEKLKRYRHFDALMTVDQANSLVQNPREVARHTFLPLLRFFETKRYFRRLDKETGKRIKKPPKLRPLRYAARADAYIYMRYRAWLSELYEERLSEAGLCDVVIAYRRIRSPYRRGNKCNIDFAYDAIRHVRRLGDCYTVCMDISGFFENLDHARLKSEWCSLLDVEELPPDHYRVFRSVTNHTVVDLLTVYERLGFWGKKKVGRKAKREVVGYLVDPRSIPPRLCNSSQMREIVFGAGGKWTDIHERNRGSFGIPQGTPISDLLANIYMFEFDRTMKARADELGGIYMRYSDDILFIVPDTAISPDVLEKMVSDTIQLQGNELEISAGKTAVHHFRSDGHRQTCSLVGSPDRKKRFEYLGFQFDGKSIRLRDSTLSSLRQKIAKSTRRAAIATSRRYRNKSIDEVCAQFDYRPLYERFGRVWAFRPEAEPTDWTFWTYVRRIDDVMKGDARPIFQQLANQKAWIRTKFRQSVVADRS